MREGFPTVVYLPPRKARTMWSTEPSMTPASLKDCSSCLTFKLDVNNRFDGRIGIMKQIYN
jgi:hypothetical protein